MATDFEHLKERVATDLAELLTEAYGMSSGEALNVLYNSETYDRLSDPQTGLYAQDSESVYAFLKKEVETGKLE